MKTKQEITNRIEELKKNFKGSDDYLSGVNDGMYQLMNDLLDEQPSPRLREVIEEAEQKYSTLIYCETIFERGQKNLLEYLIPKLKSLTDEPESNSLTDKAKKIQEDYLKDAMKLIPVKPTDEPDAGYSAEQEKLWDAAEDIFDKHTSPTGGGYEADSTYKGGFFDEMKYKYNISLKQTPAQDEESKIKSYFPKASESFGEYGKRIIGPAHDDKQDDGDDLNDDDNWQPCDDCDLPDACEDFGCAIKNGIRRKPDF